MRSSFLHPAMSIAFLLTAALSSLMSIAQERNIVPTEKSLCRDYNPILNKVVDVAYRKARELISLDNPDQKIRLVAVKYSAFYPKLYSESERKKAGGCRWVWRVSFGKHYDKPKVGGGVDVIIADSSEMEIIKVWKMK